MNRRKILQLTGTTFVTGIGTGINTNSQESEDGEGGEEGQEDPTCESNIQFGERQLIIDESGTSPTAYAAVVVENVGDAASGEISVYVDWLDQDENLIGEDSSTLPSLGARETWLAYVRAVLMDPDEIADFAASGEFDVEYPRTPQGVSVAKSNFDRGENEISGTVENTREENLGRIYAKGKIYDGNGNVLGGDSDLERNLPAGRDWRFVMGTPQLPADVEPVEHDVMLDTSTYAIPR